MKGSTKGEDLRGRVSLLRLPEFPEVTAGTDLASLILDSLRTADLSFVPGDILVLAQKIVSKAEGRLVNLENVTPSPRAYEVALQVDKDPRLVELILQESLEISRLRPGLIIVRHRLGFTCANAGIDRSNVPQEAANQNVLMLPLDPDASAARLRHLLAEKTGADIGIIISDSHGRPFRLGTVGVAIGVAGLPALWDRRGEQDRFGYELMHTDVGLADEIAAAAGLIMGQAAEGVPVVLVRGLSLPPGQGAARDLVRPAELDLYR